MVRTSKKPVMISKKPVMISKNGLHTLRFVERVGIVNPKNVHFIVQASDAEMAANIILGTFDTGVGVFGCAESTSRNLALVQSRIDVGGVPFVALSCEEVAKEPATGTFYNPNHQLTTNIQNLLAYPNSNIKAYWIIGKDNNEEFIKTLNSLDFADFMGINVSPVRRTLVAVRNATSAGLRLISIHAPA